METKIFNRRRPDFAKLKVYGIVETETGYHYETDFMDGDFRAVIDIDQSGKVSGVVIDKMNNEEYAPLRIPAQNGSYVSSVRYAYEEVLEDIAQNCYINVLFESDQANRIARQISDKYGDEPDFPWNEKPYRTSAVFRHPDTSKWYGLVMHVRRNIFDKSASEIEVNAINLKINKEDGEKLCQEAGIYPGYHMNHKLWISVLLDNTLSDQQIMELVDRSYQLTDKKK